MKTIEEAAADYKFDIDGSDWERQAAYDGFIDGANHIMSLPLASRLTAEEREKIKAIFWSALKEWVEVGEARGHCKTAKALEDIFGKAMFAEKGGSNV